MHFSNSGYGLKRSSKNLSTEEVAKIEQQKELRRALKLPVTKSLVYYKSPYNKGDAPYPVISYDATVFVDKNKNTCDWYDVTLQVMGIDEPIKIHGSYFAEMQKPNFIEHVYDSESEEI